MDGGQPKTMMSARSLAEGPPSMEGPAPASDGTPGVPARGAGFSSPPIDQAVVRAELRRWIVEHAKAPPRELTDRTPILETGLISSLDVVELVLFIEELRGREIDTDDIEPEVFTSVDTLWDGFFATLEA